MQAQIVDESSTRRSGNSRCDSDGQSLDLCLQLSFYSIPIHFLSFGVFLLLSFWSATMRLSGEDSEGGVRCDFE